MLHCVCCHDAAAPAAHASPDAGNAGGSVANRDQGSTSLCITTCLIEKPDNRYIFIYAKRSAPESLVWPRSEDIQSLFVSTDLTP